MTTQTIKVEEHPNIHLRAAGDLVVQSGENFQIRALYHGKTTQMTNLEGAEVDVSCEEDEVLLVPREATLRIETIGGDLSIRDLKSDIFAGHVGGDFNLQYAARLTAESVGGDMRLTEVTGAFEVQSIGGDLVVNHLGSDLTVQQVGGDVRAYQVDGVTNIHSAGGDVKLSLAGGDVWVSAHGDIRVGLARTTGQKVQLSAHGDVRLALPEGAAAALDLTSRHEQIKVRVGERSETVEQEHYETSFGDGSTRIKVEADGDVAVTDSKTELHHEHRDFDVFDHHIEEQIEHLNRQIEHATEMARARTEEAFERSSRKAEEKMRRATEKLHRKAMAYGFPFEVSPTPPTAEPAPAPEPAPMATEEERMLILKMLQEKKITVEEADKLFEALEPNSNE
ncbi:MAG TPA: DUF4097 family beta strand repeat-containing protein [Longilinea sp.]|nr:DUF4097 family beta strand repeat-containing protein [Longilinea sp.]